MKIWKYCYWFERLGLLLSADTKLCVCMFMKILHTLLHDIIILDYSKRCTVMDSSKRKTTICCMWERCIPLLLCVSNFLTNFVSFRFIIHCKSAWKGSRLILFKSDKYIERHRWLFIQSLPVFFTIATLAKLILLDRTSTYPCYIYDFERNCLSRWLNYLSTKHSALYSK